MRTNYHFYTLSDTFCDECINADDKNDIKINS